MKTITFTLQIQADYPEGSRTKKPMKGFIWKCLNRLECATAPASQCDVPIAPLVMLPVEVRERLFV